MKVCARRTSLAKVAMTLAPGVFTVPLGYATAGTGFGNAPACVDLDDVVGVVWVFIRIGKLGPERIVGVLSGMGGSEELMQRVFQSLSIARNLGVITCFHNEFRGAGA